MKHIIWSYGGGTQSIAIAILVATGKLPCPQRIVFADTGGEMTEVMDYLHSYVNPLLKKEIGMEVEIASHDLAKVGFYAEKDGEKSLLIPAFTKEGKLKSFCSKEWKTLVVRRFIGGFKNHKEGVKMWLGMSTDEIERLKPSGLDWVENQWPLCGMPTKENFGILMNRDSCKTLIMKFGWPDPPRSACVWCPNLDSKQWERMKKNNPQDFERAISVGDMILREDKMGGVWLHPDRKNLQDIDFKKETQSDLWDQGCDSGYCWT